VDFAARCHYIGGAACKVAAHFSDFEADHIMEHLEWTAQLACGNAAIDAAHKALIDQLSRLRSAPDTAFDDGLTALTAALEVDFREEEELMEKIDFAGLKSHREDHAAILAALHRIAPNGSSENYHLARDLLEVISYWFPVHLQAMDLPLVAALAAAGQGQPVGA
jgi:methyl-accepting chemotaxis protein